MTITLPKSQRCTLAWDTPPLGAFQHERAILSRQTQYHPTTEDGQVGRSFINAPSIHRVTLIGWVRRNAESKGPYAAATSSANTFTPTGINIHDSLYRVAKNWSLNDRTDSTERAWHWNKPQVYGSFSAMAKQDGPNYSVESGALTLAMNHVGTISGQAIYPSGGLSFSVKSGGYVNAYGQFVIDGATTYDPATDVDWLFDDSDIDPPGGVATIVLDTGETITHKLLVHGWTIECSKRVGGSIKATLHAVFDKADT